MMILTKKTSESGVALLGDAGLGGRLKSGQNFILF